MGLLTMFCRDETSSVYASLLSSARSSVHWGSTIRRSTFSCSDVGVVTSADTEIVFKVLGRRAVIAPLRSYSPLYVHNKLVLCLLPVMIGYDWL